MIGKTSALAWPWVRISSAAASSWVSFRAQMAIRAPTHTRKGRRRAQGCAKRFAGMFGKMLPKHPHRRCGRTAPCASRPKDVPTARVAQALGGAKAKTTCNSYTHVRARVCPHLLWHTASRCPCQYLSRRLAKSTGRGAPTQPQQHAPTLTARLP